MSQEPEHWKTLEHFYHAALEREPDRRAAFLQEACPDLAVRRQVESLLGYGQQGDELLERPPLAGDPPPPPSAWIGCRVGHYRLIAEIGHGGMGRVFRAERDDDQFRKQVAVKIIGAGAISPEMLRRFLDERQMLATLDHPNIARLLDGGITDDGMPYMVMDYVAGRPITEHCSQAALEVRERLELFRVVSLAVHYAHQHLIVHRDLKPGNILVTPEGSPVLLDFGIARMLDPLTARAEATMAAFHPMTPDYASPEQLRGAALTTATDVYSLGVILYQMLTGVLPYDLARGTLEEAVRTVNETDPVKPSDHREAGLRRFEDLDFIVLKAMRKPPQERYASVQELADDVQRCLDGRPVLAQQGTWRYAARKWVARHKLAMAVAAAALVLSVAGVGAVAWEAHIANLERARAQNRFDELRGLARSVIFELHDEIATLPGSTPVRRKLVTRALTYLDSLARGSAGDPGLQAELAQGYERLGNVLGKPSASNLGDLAGAIASYRKGLDVTQAALARNPLRDDVLRSEGLLYQDLAEVEFVSGKRAEARDAAERGLKIMQARSERASSDRNRRTDLATAFLEMFLITRADNPLNARKYLNQAMALYQANLTDQPDDDGALNRLALAYRYQASLETGEAALAYDQRSLELDERRAASNPSNAVARLDVSVDLSEIALVYGRIGQPAQALKYARRALLIRQELAAADPKNVLARRRLGYSHLSLASELLATGDMPGALESARISIQIFADYVATNPSDTQAIVWLAYGYLDKADALSRLGQRQAACQAYRSIHETVTRLDKSGAAAQQIAEREPGLKPKLVSCDGAQRIQ